MSTIKVGYFDDGSENNLATRFAAVTAAGGDAAVAALGQGRTTTTLAPYLAHKGTANVRDFGADNTGVADSTTAIQAALNTGLPVEFPDGDYKAVGLTQSTDFQRLFSHGRARIIKSGNGVILASTGNGVQCENLDFRGESSTPAFTGDNVTFSGNDVTLLNCSSRWAFGRAVKATGSHVQIKGVRDIYQTADTTSSGYDIEIGVSGTATLYHEIDGVHSSQRTGGILLIDTGAHTINGGQFGKLYIRAGTKPSGVNGGKTIGARILGDVTVEISNAIFSANQFDAIAVTLALGTSGCLLDATNVYAVGATVTNNGNVNNLILRQVSTGSTVQLKVGDDSSLAVLTFAPSSGQIGFSKNVTVENNQAIQLKDSSGNPLGQLSMTTANTLAISNTASGNISVAVAAGSRIPFFVGGVEKIAVEADGSFRIGGAGGPTLTAAQLTDLTDGGDSSLHFHSADRSRANHTGTQSLSTIAGGTATGSGYTLPDLTVTGVLMNNVNVVTTTTALTLVASQQYVRANASGGAFTITLPTAVGAMGETHTIKKTDSSANAVTIATTSSQTIDGVTTQSLAAQYNSLTVISNGTNWDLV